MSNQRTLLPPSLPPDFAEIHPDLAKLIDELIQMRAERNRARQERMALERSYPIARSKDEAAAIVATREGRPDPPTANQNALSRQIGPLEKRERDLQRAIPAVERDLVALHDAHSGQWAVEAHERAVTARAEAREATEAAKRAVEAVQAADALTAWSLGNKVLPLSSRVTDGFTAITRALASDRAAIEEAIEEAVA